MGAPVQRKGDANSAGGVIRSGNTSVLVNGRPIATTGLGVTPHPCCGRKGCPPTHCAASTSGGATTVRVNGRPISLASNKDTCGHARTGGSTNVRAV